MEELVATATAAELGKAATAEAARLRAEVDRLSTRCETCLVMLGEGRIVWGFHFYCLCVKCCPI